MRKLHEPGSVRELVEQICGDLQGKARFSRATRPGQRHEPMSGQLLFDRSDFLFPPHKRGELQREIIRERVESVKRRELRWKSQYVQLVQPFRAQQIFQASLAKINELGIF